MSPPSYRDIRKVFRDILSKKYNSNTWFVSYKDKFGPAYLRIHMDTMLQTQNCSASVESKLHIEQFGGFTIKEKLDSNNVLSAYIIFKDKLFDGLTNTLGLVYELRTGQIMKLLKNTFKSERINMSSQFSFKSESPDIFSSIVLKCNDFLLGTEICVLNTKKGEFRANFSIAYSIDDFCFYGSISNWNKSYSAGIYQKISNRLKFVGETTWIRDFPDMRWALGLCLHLDQSKHHVILAKVDNLAQLSLSLSSELTSGVKASVCALVNQSIHSQVGFGLHIER